jgi:hypothetical protein
MKCLLLHEGGIMDALLQEHVIGIRNMRAQNVVPEKFSRFLDSMNFSIVDRYYTKCLYALASQPRTEVFSFAPDALECLPIPEEYPENRLRVFSYWEKPWMIKLEVPNRSIVIMHDYIIQENMGKHIFCQCSRKFASTITLKMLTTYEPLKKMARSFVDNIEIEEYSPIKVVRLYAHCFLLAYERDENVEVVKAKRKNKPRGSRKHDNESIIYSRRTLSRKGKRYISEKKSSNKPEPMSTADKLLKTIEVRTYERWQRFGPGYSQKKKITIEKHTSKKWIKKCDKIVKVVVG